MPGCLPIARPLEMLEETGKLPDVDGVIAVLDRVFQCDGRLGVYQGACKVRYCLSC